MKYYDKVIDQSPMPVDYLNAGHVAWSLGNVEKTLSLYTKAAELYGSKELFLEVFRKDEEIITSKGVTPVHSLGSRSDLKQKKKNRMIRVWQESITN